MSRCIHSVPISDPCVKCALANATGAPFDEKVEKPAEPEVSRSSLISDLNASVDPVCPHKIDLRYFRCPLCGEGTGEAGIPAPGPDCGCVVCNVAYGVNDVVRGPGYCAGRDRERARIRAIVMRLMGNEWSANQLLEEIGE